MKRILTILFFLFLIFGKAQTFNGTLMIRDTGELYLNQMYVTNIRTDQTVLADYQGDFSIPAKIGDVIRFTSIVTERRDIVVTPDMLARKRSIIQLDVAYQEIQGVTIFRFRPTGNLKVDVLSLPPDKNLILQQKIGLPVPKYNLAGTNAPLANFKNGGLGLDFQGIFDILSGDRKRQERLNVYETMMKDVSDMRKYFGDDYFLNRKIPENLIDNFLQFVYTSDNLRPALMNRNYVIAQLAIEKYLPIYLRRVRNSNLENIVKQKQS